MRRFTSSGIGRSTCVVKRASFGFVFVIDASLLVPVSLPVEVPVTMAIILIIG